MNTSTISSGQNLNPVSDGDDPVFPEQAVASGREIGSDEDNELLTSARQTSDTQKRYHKGGTNGVSWT